MIVESYLNDLQVQPVNEQFLSKLGLDPENITKQTKVIFAGLNKQIKSADYKGAYNKLKSMGVDRIDFNKQMTAINRESPDFTKTKNYVARILGNSIAPMPAHHIDKIAFAITGFATLTNDKNKAIKEMLKKTVNMFDSEVGDDIEKEKAEFEKKQKQYQVVDAFFASLSVTLILGCGYLVTQILLSAVEFSAIVVNMPILSGIMIIAILFIIFKLVSALSGLIRG